MISSDKSAAKFLTQPRALEDCHHEAPAETPFSIRILTLAIAL